MFSLNVTNAAVDPVACVLIEQTFAVMTPPWQELLPSNLQIILCNKPLFEVKELELFWSAQSLPRSERKFVHIVCPEFDQTVSILWARYDPNSPMLPTDYCFKKELYSVIAQMTWILSGHLRTIAAANATGMAEDDEVAQYMAFRDSFSRFFLNPEWLRRSKPAAWCFINRVDQILKTKNDN